MPLENRVDPFGTIFRSPARGTFMGNRGGAIHNDRREIVRAFKNQRWITCVLEFRGRHRSVMSPGRYTELFFLDEAVAFAAGHRPCAECRRERFLAFKLALQRRDASAPDIDAELHRARIVERPMAAASRLSGGWTRWKADPRAELPAPPLGRKVTYQAELNSLPNGTFVELDGSAHLVWNDALLLWTPQRYARKQSRPNRLTITVLTPQPIVECFRQGYEPEVHDSSREAAGHF